MGHGARVSLDRCNLMLHCFHKNHGSHTHFEAKVPPLNKHSAKYIVELWTLPRPGVKRTTPTPVPVLSSVVDI